LISAIVTLPPHDQERIARARNGALDQDQVALGVDAHHGQLLDGDLLVAHVPGHARVLEDAPRRRTGANRTGSAVVVRAVGLWATPEVMPGNDAGEALALAHPGHVDQLPRLEQAHVDLLTDAVLVHRVDPHLAHGAQPLVLAIQLLELASHRLGDALCRPAAELQGGIAVLLRRPEPRHGVRGSLDDAHRHDASVVAEDARHPDLSPDQSCRHCCRFPSVMADGRGSTSAAPRITS
jgi:hypothetical protein